MLVESWGDFAGVLKRPYGKGLLANSTIKQRERDRKQREARVQMMRGVSVRSGALPW
jgi:hypothetical protein